jgi:hypothetical protein
MKGDRPMSWFGKLRILPRFKVLVAVGVYTAAIGCAAGPAQAAPDNGPAERIEFVLGSSGTTVDGTLTAGAKDLYVLTASATQTMSVSVTGGAVAESAAPGGTLIAQPSASWTVTLPVDGDYYIAVTTPATTVYQMSITVIDGGGPGIPASTSLPAAAAVTAVPDLSEATVPALCGYPAGTLSAGVLPAALTSPGAVGWTGEAVVADLDGDGTAETVGSFYCNGGGIGWPEQVVVFRKDGSPVGVLDLADVAVPGQTMWRATASALVPEAGSVRVDGSFEQDAMTPLAHVPIWLTIVDGRLAAFLSDGSTVPVVCSSSCATTAMTVPAAAGAAPASPWTFEGDGLRDVPQMGSEPVLGSGCGGSGQIGEIIPDGWWLVLVDSSNSVSMGLDLMCAYHGDAAIPFYEQCVRETQDACAWDTGFMPVNNSDRIRGMPVSPGIVREIEPNGYCRDGGVAAYEANYLGMAMTWIRVSGGQVDYVRYYCPFG